MLFRSIFIFCLFVFTTPLWAGEPVTERLACPVGGEKFKITGTLSCSTLGRTMSMRPITSCDFITRLPVCPSNGLPVYQKFSTEQVEILERFVDTDDYKAIGTLPPWQRAYGIAKYLDQSGTKVAFGLLLKAFWYETAPLLQNSAAMDQFLGEAEAELRRAPDADRPFLNALLAYALFAAGRTQEAEHNLQHAKTAPNIPESLQQYISAIEGCKTKMASAGCLPDAPLDP